MKVELRNLQRDTRSLDGIVTMKKAGSRWDWMGAWCWIGYTRVKKC